jgi:transcriptional regulator with XRE-family HTH domain
MTRATTKATIRPLKERIGSSLRKHRVAKGFTQEGFADHIKMHRAYYGELERGLKDFQLSTFERVCEGLETPMWQITKDAESMS